jgi:hypothetical protein
VSAPKHERQQFPIRAFLFRRRDRSPEAALKAAQAASERQNAALQATAVQVTPEQATKSDMAQGKAPSTEDACALIGKCGGTAAAKQLEAQASVPVSAGGAAEQGMAAGTITATQLASAAGNADPAMFAKAANDALTEGVPAANVMQEASTRAAAASRITAAATLPSSPAQEIRLLLATAQLTSDNPSVIKLAGPLSPKQFINIVATALAAGESVDQAIGHAVTAVADASKGAPNSLVRQANGQ